MRPILVNTKQKVAVLASGLAIASTGVVTYANASTKDQTQQGPSADVATQQQR